MPLSEALPEFILLTGALGSGKTTLLSNYLAAGEMADTGIIINDAGEINIDGAVIRADTRSLSLATLSNGCVCCSMGNSVQEGIDALLLVREEMQLGPPRRIILETSGLAEPGPILRSLRQIGQMEFKVRVVATFDASSPRQGDSFFPHYASQLAAAQAIVMTKLEALSPEFRSIRAKEAKAFNPFASLIMHPEQGARARAAFESDIASSSGDISRYEASEATTHRISSALARWDHRASWEDIAEWIENVSGYFGFRLLRMKGLVRPSGFSSPVLINGIGGVFSPPRPIKNADGEALGLMMILRDIGPSEFADATGSNAAVEVRFK